MAYRSGRTNAELCENMRKEGLIASSEVMDAFLAVDRGHFLPPQIRDRAYLDEPVHSDDGIFHLSAPHMYATVMESLSLSPGLSFLNIGSGTGYLSFLVAKIVGPHVVNHGIEHKPELVEFAASRCAKVKEFANMNFIRFRCGDAFSLAPPSVRYDRIYIGGGVQFEATIFFQDFLNHGGIMVAPRGEELVSIQRTSINEYRSNVISKVRFESLKEKDPRITKLAGTQNLHPRMTERNASTNSHGISIAKLAS